MNLEEVKKLSIEEKKKLLKDLITNDICYWKKIWLLMQMIEDDEDTEFLDFVIDNKTNEINLANKKFNLNINANNDLNDLNDIINNIIYNNEDINYNKACKEVLEILKHIPKKYIEMINQKFLDKLNNDADKNYNFEINNVINYSELELLDKSKDIILLITEKYWKKNDININKIFNKGE